MMDFGGSREPNRAGRHPSAIMMGYRKLGKTELMVSEVGLGCQSIGGGLYHGNKGEALNLLHHAYDAGITFYDTSDHYSLGNSEALLGQAFRGRRDKVVIATKAGTRYSPSAKIALKLRPLLRPFGRMLRSAKLSLHHLRAAERHYDFSPEYLIRC
ncbi:MAG: aldo/keto reductase, partial [Pseudomonadota bacterium]